VRDAIASRFSSAGAAASTNVESFPTLVQTIVGMVPQNPIAAAAQGDLLALIFFVVVLVRQPPPDDARRSP
jgi:Na+/H+-dicarboxylate symporter